MKWITKLNVNGGGVVLLAVRTMERGTTIVLQGSLKSGILGHVGDIASPY